MKTIFKIILCFLVPILLQAEEVTFVASVSKNPVEVGEQFKVTFTLNNARGTNFKAPSFKNFTVLMGPSQMSSTQIINGKVSSSQSYTYYLQANSVGKFTIEPALIFADNRTLSSNSLEITVVKAGSQPKKQADDQPRSIDQQARDYLKDKLFIKMYLNKRNVYQGEQLMVTYKVYYSPDLQISGVKSSTLPKFNGFWSNEINLEGQKPTRELVNGVNFYVQEVKKVILIPQQTGNLTIEPLEVEYVIALPVREGWFTRYQNFDYKAVSNTDKVYVNPLPENKPINFSGGVGSFTMRATIDKQKTKTNEPVTLKITISGTGNLKLIEPFSLDVPPNIDYFDPKTSESISYSGGVMSGSKTFEYLLIPRVAGTYKIPAVSFAYFNLNKKSYEELKSETFEIEVEKGTGTSVATIPTGAGKEEIKFIGKDIRFIKNLPSRISKDNGFVLGSFVFFAFSVLPLALAFIFILAKKKNEELKSNQILLKNRRALKLAKKRLSLAQKYLKQQDADKFFDEVADAFWGFFSDKFAIEKSRLTKDEIINRTNSQNIDPELIRSVLELIDNCELARFAPLEEKPNLNEVYKKSTELLSNLESILK